MLVFEDVHWGEEPLLELIEHLAAWVREAPLLLLCIARTELLDVRPTWGGGRVRSTAIELEPLPPEESAELVAALTSRARAAGIDTEAVLAKTEGNPLFVEETVRMLAERPRGGAERIPDTLQSLIAARIDRLPGAQRLLLQRAAVMGRIFMVGALERLSPEVDDVRRRARRAAAPRPRRARAARDDQRRGGVQVQARAHPRGRVRRPREELARRPAPRASPDWLGERAGDELLEIRAFHLDQAARLLARARRRGARGPARGGRGRARRTAGRRALSREAFRSARKLLLRAVELAPTLERRYSPAAPHGGSPTCRRSLVEMEEVAVGRASTAGDAPIQGRALTALAEADLQHRADAVTARGLVAQAVEVLRDESPEIRFEPLWIASQVARWFGDSGEFERWAKPALAGRARGRAQGSRGARRAQPRAARTSSGSSSTRRRRSSSARSSSPTRAAASSAARRRSASAAGSTCVSDAPRRGRGGLHGRARPLRRGRQRDPRGGMTMMIGRAAFAQGDLDRAEKLLRDSVRTLKGLGDRGSLCEAQRALAMVLVEQGRIDEAERFALEARETVGPEDRVSRLDDEARARHRPRRAGARRRGGGAAARGGRGARARRAARARARGAPPPRSSSCASAGRDDEAVPYEERCAELSPSSTAPIV